MRRLVAIAAVAFTIATTLGACRAHTVQIVFAPDAGARYRYDVAVQAVTVTEIDGADTRRSAEDFVLHARHRVVRVDDEGIQLEVQLDVPGSGVRTFTVRFDRGAQLAAVERIEGLPASALGQIGLSEIFPGVATAPPERRLAPGDRWEIDSPVAPLSTEGGRLAGHGRLLSLGVVRDRKVATIETTYRLPVARTASSVEGDILFDGTQTTVATTTHALRDGAVESARAITRGSYALTFLPPPDTPGAPVSGRLTVEVRSTTRRV